MQPPPRFPGLRGACHRARIRATRWLHPGYKADEARVTSKIWRFEVKLALSKCLARLTPCSAMRSWPDSRWSAPMKGRRRELCPHILGTNKRGEEAVLAWQFAGESSGKLPQWRCLRLADIRDARARNGPWHAGGSHRTSQTCVSNIDLDINIHVRKLR